MPATIRPIRVARIVMTTNSSTKVKPPRVDGVRGARHWCVRMASLLIHHAHELAVEVAQVVETEIADGRGADRRPLPPWTKRLVAARRDDLEAAGVVELRRVGGVLLRLRVGAARHERRAIAAVAVVAQPGAEIQVRLGLRAHAGLARLLIITIEVRRERIVAGGV